MTVPASNGTPSSGGLPSALELVLARLDGRVRTRDGSNVQAICPAHDDQAPGLSVGVGRDGRVLLKCHAGCSAESIVVALGLTMRDLFRARSSCGPSPAQATVYMVRNGEGLVMAEHVRMDLPHGKKMFWRRPDGQKGLGGTRTSDLPLYGSERLKTWQAEVPTVIAEGEKATDALREHGFQALGTVTGAAGTPGIEALEVLRGREVILWPDRDQAGTKHMARIAARLDGIATSVRIFTDEGATEDGDDAADFFARGGSPEALTEALLSAPVYGGAEATKPEAAPPETVGDTFHHTTDCGNARRLVALHGRDFRHVIAWRRYIAWDGQRWKLEGGDLAVQEAAKAAAATIREEAARARDYKTAQDLLNAWRRAESERGIRAMMNLARSIPGIPIEHEGLDRHPFKLNVRNGTIDLETGKLRPHDRGDLFLSLCPIEYRHDARSPLWEAFLDRIFAGDRELIAYVQRLIGYSLTGSTSDHVFPIFWGGGANGKSTLIKTVLALLGDDLGTTVPTSLFLAKRGETHPTERALLFAKRLAVGVETRELGRLDEEAVKALTGGDRIVARRMREDFWSFSPTSKLILVTNHKPRIAGTDHALWRRVVLVPFAVTIPEADQDKTLGDKLLAELPGILAWAVLGCLEWQRHGLDPPDAIRVATSEYRQDSDLVGRFVAQCCEMESKAKEPSKKLYEAFVWWVNDAGETPLRPETFGARLTEAGFGKEHAKAGNVRIGLRLKPDVRTAVAEARAHETMQHSLWDAPGGGEHREHPSR